jgi:hypothetical protein
MSSGAPVARGVEAPASAIPWENSSLLPSLDGTEPVVAAAHGLALFANNGTFRRDIGPSAKACSPNRWWDVNGWKVGDTVYVQALGAYGSEFLARRMPNGTTKKVTVPKAANDERAIGAGNDQVALQAVLGCGGGQSLFWFDPTTAKEIPLLGPPLNGGGVLAAFSYPGLQP